MGSVWNYLDMTALACQEIWEDSPEGYPQSRPYKWWNWHDSYVPDAPPDPKWIEVSDAGEAAFRKRADDERARSRSLSAVHGPVNTSPTDYYPIEQMQITRFNGEYMELFSPMMSGALAGNG
jgi:hypothetical protein